MAKKLNQPDSTMSWFILAALSLFLLCAPFQKALFNGSQHYFDVPIYLSILVSAICFFLLTVYKLTAWKNKYVDIRFEHVLVWLLPMSYGISNINAVSDHMSNTGLLISIMYAIFFSVGSFLGRSNYFSGVTLKILLVGSYIIVSHGIVNWFGLGHYQDAVLGYRLAGVFQYPNTYAGFLIAVFLSSLLLVTYSKSNLENIVAGLFLLPTAASILLTSSRGSLLVLPVVFLLVILFQTLKKQIIFSLIAVISFGLSFVISPKLDTIGAQIIEGNFSDSLLSSGLVWLLVPSVCISLVVLFIRKYTENIIDTPNGFKRLIVPIILFLLSAIALLMVYIKSPIILRLLPDTLILRIYDTNMEDSSILGRLEFYKDSISVLRDFLWFGAGGGAWSALYELYQTNPYTSRQVHNFYLQYLIETGVIGFLLLILLFATVARNFLQKVKELTNFVPLMFFTFASALLIHSAVDFDMSFVFIGAITFLSLGVIGVKENINKGSTTPKVLVNSFKVVGILVSIFVIVTSVQKLNAHNYYVEYMIGLQNGKPYEVVMHSLEKAINADKSNTNYLLSKTKLLLQVFGQTRNTSFLEEAKAVLVQLKETDPFNKQAAHLEESVYLSTGDLQKVLELNTTHRSQYSWDPVFLERMIIVSFNLANVNEEFKQSAISEFERYNQRINSFKNVDVTDFQPTVTSKLIVSEFFYQQKEYQKVEEILKTEVGRDQQAEGMGRNIVRLYLSSLIMQNKNAEELYEKFIGQYPEEVDLIKQYTGKM